MLSEGLQRHNDVYYHITNVQYLIETHSAEETPENRHETVNKMFEFIVAQVEDCLGYTFRKKPLTSAAHKEYGEPSDGLLQSVADADMKIRMAQIPQAMPNELIAVPKTHQWQVIRNMIKPPLSPGESDVDVWANDDTSASGYSTFGLQMILQMGQQLFSHRGRFCSMMMKSCCLSNTNAVILLANGNQYLNQYVTSSKARRTPVGRPARCTRDYTMLRKPANSETSILSILQTVMFVIGCCSHRRTTTCGISIHGILR